MGSFSIWHWLIVLLVVVLIFGTKKLRNIGGDVGGAVKSFKDAMNEEKNSPTPANHNQTTVIENQPKSLEITSIETEVVKPAAKKRAPAAKKPAAAKTNTAKSTAAKPAATKAAVKPKAVTAKKPSAAKPKTTAKKAEPQ